MSADTEKQYLTAKNLIQVCSTPSESWISFCHGYYQSAFDWGALNGVICAPPGTTRNDLSRLFDNHAASLNIKEESFKDLAAHPFVVKVISEAYPCN